ncbi:hypothetical protein DE146DRAFT_677586 [Phaeosphaeria sp. MPI-PUGE-AT-0046c]|nr:hypothetical protein DE146DRAFT_677586 [Phaeosphaeria sp. MPI-PUGE-AT-0046c]
MQSNRALSSSNKKNLLICLDAFDTLFTPKEPISVTYAQSAFRHGLPTSGEENANKIMKSFKSAFKGEAQRNPNYGRSSGMGAERWWSNVINHTFQPFIEPKEKVPRALITELYHKFATKEAYCLYPDVKDFFSELRKYRKSRPTKLIQWPYEKIIVGIITNSDNRVPGILQSFGLEVAPRHVGTTTKTDADCDTEKDIEFVVMSYDVGHEKPDCRIFDAATQERAETWRLREALRGR